MFLYEDRKFICDTIKGDRVRRTLCFGDRDTLQFHLLDALAHGFRTESDVEYNCDEIGRDVWDQSLSKPITSFTEEELGEIKRETRKYEDNRRGYNA